MTVLIQRSPSGFYHLYKSKEVKEVADLIIHRPVDIEQLLEELPSYQVAELEKGYVIVANIDPMWLANPEN